MLESHPFANTVAAAFPIVFLLTFVLHPFPLLQRKRERVGSGTISKQQKMNYVPKLSGPFEFVQQRELLFDLWSYLFSHDKKTDRIEVYSVVSSGLWIPDGG